MKGHLKKIYRFKKDEICSRLNEFKTLWSDADDEDLFEELAFCILTPQTKAKVCWNAIERLKEQGLLFKGNVEQIVKRLFDVRFKNKKAQYIVDARKFFTNDGKICMKPGLRQFENDIHPDRKEAPPFIPFRNWRFLTGFGWGKKTRVGSKAPPELPNGVYACREWLVQNIKGIGYKEASHFLRNIGFGENIAILDRHILKNLRLLGVIEEIPESIRRVKYLQIEKDMAGFARKIDIPISHLDLLFWYKETGEIFK